MFNVMNLMWKLQVCILYMLVSSSCTVKHAHAMRSPIKCTVKHAHAMRSPIKCTVKHAHAMRSPIKQSPVLKGHPFLILS